MTGCWEPFPRAATLALLGMLTLLGGCRDEVSAPTLLEGVWEGQLTEEGGRSTLLVTLDRFHFQGPDRADWIRGRFHIEPGDPGWLDLAVEECDCDFSGETIAALYQLRGISLTLATAGPGEARPTSLSPTEGGARLFELRRVGE